MRQVIATIAVILICCCAVFFRAQETKPPVASRSGTATAQADPKGLIEGKVVNAVTGDPLKKVTLMLSMAGSITPLSGDTDENGHFVFKNLKAGRYILIGERTGFARQAYGARSNALAGTALAIAADQEIKDLVFKLSPTAVIAGKVLDDDGEPVPNAMVMALRPAYVRGKRQFSPAGLAPTNDMGEFRIANLKAGKYIISAAYRNITTAVAPSGEKPADDKPESTFIMTYYPGVTEAAEATAIELGTGTEVGGTNVQLIKVNGFRVRGKVMESLQGRMVLVTLTPKGAGVISLLSRPMAVVQQDGNFEFKGVIPGSYTLGAVATDMGGLGAVVPVEVTDKHLDGLLLQTGEGADLPVNLSVEGKSQVDLKGVRITLEPSDGQGIMPKGAGMEEGKLLIKSLAPGRYEVRVANLPDNHFVKTVRIGASEAGEDRVIDLSGGVGGTLYVVLNPNGAQVDGVVRGEDGNPLSGATVALIPESKRAVLYMNQTTDQRGGFSFKGVTPGEYKILAWEDIESGAYQDPDFVKRFEGEAQALSIKENDRKAVAMKAIPFEKTKSAQ